MAGSLDFDALLRAARTLEAEIAAGPIVPTVTPETIRTHLAGRYDFSGARDVVETCRDVERMLGAWQVQVTHPRYFGLFNPSVMPASVVADAMVALYNPQLATWRTSPAANEIEQHTLRWVSSKFGFPAESAANFTTGGAEANLSGVAVALTRAFPGYGEDGLRSVAGIPSLYVSRHAHHSFNKIAHLTGIGRRALRAIHCDADLRMDVAQLARRVEQDRRKGFSPFMVVGTAGTTVSGAIDPLRDLARFCEAERLWLHVDAAWGGAAMLSAKLRPYLDGIDAADSITCDAHKWFSVPMGAGMFFCRHADAVDQAFRAETSYMPGRTQAVRDPYTSSVQWSRRFIGLKLFLALAEQGESGYIDVIENQASLGDALRDALRSSGWRIVNNTPLPLVCFTRDGLDTAAFLAALYRHQIAWMSDVRLDDDGAPVLRACITSYRTTKADIDWVVREMQRLPLQ